MFVTFEGPEGAGKSTAIQSVAQSLRQEGHKVVTTREPGGSSIGTEVRKLLLEGNDLLGVTELFLFLADRAQHTAEVIRPALEREAIVICDRFADSTIVYQGYGRGLDIAQLKMLNSIAIGDTVPNLTLLLDIDAELGLSRLTSKDRIDSEPFEFHQLIRNGFLAEAELEPTRWTIIDASRSADHCFTT